MIGRREIIDAATALSLLPQVVEKDYVLGWVLAGINQHPALAETWIFKVGPVSRNASSNLSVLRGHGSSGDGCRHGSRVKGIRQLLKHDASIVKSA